MRSGQRHTGQRHAQRGVTLIGWIVILIPFVIVGYAAVRLLPVYLNYQKVAKTLETTATEMRGNSDADHIRNTIEKHFDIDMVDYPTAKDVKITRDGQSWVLECEYEDQAPLFGNITLHVAFDKRSVIGGGGD
jgi:Domain of unknown function (DUF4845)